MRTFDEKWLMSGVAAMMRRDADNLPTFDGTASPYNVALLDSCTARYLLTGAKLIFTRDAGMHSSGWWKNPDYERCFHLSLSFVDPATGEPRDKDMGETEKWLDAFYRDAKCHVWSEPPFSKTGKAFGMWHYRVFCTKFWTPITPRGEVYSRELTEAGWKSFSELQASHADALSKLQERIADA